MKDFQFFIGVDMAKLTLDYCVIDAQANIIIQGQVLNQTEHILAWIKSLPVKLEIPSFWTNTLLCLEHAGYYATPLLTTLHQNIQTSIWLESALQIKRSIGVQRGKSDKIDAYRIAIYALDFQRKATLWKPTSLSIQRLQLLLSHRDRQVKCCMSLRNTLKEEKGFIPEKLHQEMIKLNTKAIKALEKSIQQIDTKIQQLLKKDTQFKQLQKIIQSMPGFGPVITPKLIAVTHGFTRLTDPRAFACFAGVAPFEHKSGTSLKGKTRISHLANKDIKKMLHLAALVTIRKNNIIHDYFNRKVQQGKNKMSIINAIRNKLIHILFACIKNNTTYQKKYQHSLA